MLYLRAVVYYRCVAALTGYLPFQTADAWFTLLVLCTIKRGEYNSPIFQVAIAHEYLF